MTNDFLDSLNGTQLKAATYPANASLQILAGPGSGKTRVLTSRIAHLILNCHLPPRAICAVTFTNKAANEMRERLTKLIGKEQTTQLKMGTFHSLCARFLRKYAALIEVADNFTVCDAAESKKIIGKLVKAFEAVLNKHQLPLEPATAASIISKAKSRGQSAESYLSEAEAKAKDHTFPIHGSTEAISLEVIVGKIYVGYEAELKRNNALDFDDLLIYGVKLFSQHRETVLWCRHILVDEFQDTNITQYQLLQAIGVARHATVVGDPDQSIYGWRSAEIKNLEKMCRDFPNTAQILLEENYRSTGAILEVSLAIVSQDTKRIDKSLYTSHPDGVLPVLYQLSTEQEEAAFIAIEIKRLVANMGGVFRWGDFAILLRFNALSRVLENALQKERIPCRILGGHKFFERLEVKDILAYLQLIDNPVFGPAFIRVINVPGRGIGEKTLGDISNRSEQTGKSPLELLEAIYDMKIPDNKPAIRKKISTFIQAIRKLRNLSAEGMGPSELIRRVVDLVEYEEHLRKTQQDWEIRLENVKELINFAKEIEEQVERDNSAPVPQQPGASGDLDTNASPLRQFLQASMLSSAGDNDGEEESKDKVTISTCHSAKGLEWPVVMIPSVDNSTYPFIRSEDEDEERRLLYVACTRAKSLLYLTRPTSRMVAGDVKRRQLSKFITAILEKNHKEGKRPLLNQHVPQLELEDRAIICKVLERPAPDETEVERMVEEFAQTRRELPTGILWNRSAGPQRGSVAPNSNHFPSSFGVPTHFQPTFAPSDFPPSEMPGFQLLSGGPLTNFYRPPVHAVQSSSKSLQNPSPNPRQHPVIPPPPSLAPPVAASTFHAFSRVHQTSASTLQQHNASPAQTYPSPRSRAAAQARQLRFEMQAGPTISSSGPSIPNHPYRTPVGSTRSTPSASSSSYPSTTLQNTQQLKSPSKPRQGPAAPLQTVSNQARTPPAQPIQATVSPSPIADAQSSAPPINGVKRRLGMGRTATGYSNKKFKLPK